ncbi:MAG: hypothetical protein Q4C60_07205 [Eubacteriales bacterium]|nr:hypothetical protein [Eubacteriales bacterium]
MTSVFLIFIYMAVTTFLLGFGSLSLLRRLTGETKAEKAAAECGQGRETPCPADGAAQTACGTAHGVGPDGIALCMAGLVTATVYAQFFSLLGGVGLAANAGLIALCALSALCCRRELAAFRFLKPAVLLLLALLFAYGTSRGYIHYDSDLYHAQSIRWIETYGIAPGLANLHTRLGYNSSAFALSALYSFAFLGGQSYHACAGFLALLVAAESLKLLRIFRGAAPALSDFARLGALYYLFTIFDEMVSPASDYFMVLGAFYLIIRFLALIERREHSYFPYAALAMLAVCIVTFKLSAVCLLLVAVKPVGMLLKKRRFGPFFLFLATALLIAAPFLIRNVILTGWLFYPMTAIDLFSFDWKVPQGVADADAREIAVWGRGYTDVSLYGAPVSYWVRGWFLGQGTTDKLFLLLDLAAIPGSVLWFLAALRSERRTRSVNRNALRMTAAETGPEGPISPVQRHEQEGHGASVTEDTSLPSATDTALVMGTLLCSLSFWFLNAPLIRYGCVYVYLSAFVFIGLLLTWRFPCAQQNSAQKAVWPEAAFRQAGEQRTSRSEADSRKADTQQTNSPAASRKTAASLLQTARRGVCLAFFLLFLVYKLLATGAEQLGQFENAYWIFQKDYNHYEVVPYEIDGHTFYYAGSGDQTGYDAFPSSPTPARIRMRGESLRNGFVYDEAHE